VAGGNGANDFGGQKIAMRPYVSYQVAIAVVVGTLADVYPSDTARISDIARGSCEVLDFVRYIACGRVAD